MKGILFLFFSFLTSSLCAQQFYLYNNRDINFELERSYACRSDQWHPNIKPVLMEDVPHYDSLFGVVSGNKKGYLGEFQKGDARGNKNWIKVNRMLDLSVGSEPAHISLTSQYMGGLSLSGGFKKKFFYSLNGMAGVLNQLPSFSDSVVIQTQALPSIGHINGSAPYTLNYIDAFVSYTPSSNFVLTAGNGKNFIGDGYRSLLLSDHATTYPFFKIHTKVWKFQYVNLYALLNQYNLIGPAKEKKFMAMHYLSFNAGKKLNFSFFENIVWANRDTSGRSLGFDPHYLNPVVFYRPVEYSVGSADNAFIGVSARWNIVKNFQLYSQVMIDEFFLSLIKARNGWWANKQAFQGGLKWFNIAGVKGLSLQGEINYIRPYTYSHGLVLQNYGHTNTPLAHPGGANLQEALGLIRYFRKQWMLELKVNVMQYGDDLNGKNYGKNIYESYVSRPSDFGNYTTQGLTTTLLQASFRAAYYLSYQGNLCVESGIQYRSVTNVLNENNSAYFFIGLRTSIFNNYTDF